jgi:predicted MFS family arabinose efflux permease
MALGAFVAGWVVDEFGPHSGFWVSVAAASLALAIVTLGQCVLGEGRGRVAEVRSEAG